MLPVRRHFPHELHLPALRIASKFGDVGLQVQRDSKKEKWADPAHGNRDSIGRSSALAVGAEFSEDAEAYPYQVLHDWPAMPSRGPYWFVEPTPEVPSKWSR
jgi:hypothetical protein